MAVGQLAPTTRARILDAAFQVIADFGLSRFTMEDVAGRASISRQTVYRYFPSKDDLLVALVLRESEAFLEGVRGALQTDRPLAEAIEDAVTFVLRYARRHPLLDRLLATDPEILVPHLTTRGGPVIERARETLEELLLARLPESDPVRVRAASDAGVRLLLSHVVTPSAAGPETVARSAALALMGVLEAS